MVKTGYISFITNSGGGYDENGNAVAPSIVNSDYVECNLATVNKDYKFFVDGQYIQAKYSIYVDSDKISSLIPTISIENIKSVSIKNNNADLIGSFQVQNLEYLNLTKRIKIEL